MDEPYIYHFPDGNASLGRLMVRSLIPAVAPGSMMQGHRDRAVRLRRVGRSAGSTRVRLRSTVVHVANRDGGVDVGCVREGKVHRLRAARCVQGVHEITNPMGSSPG